MIQIDGVVKKYQNHMVIKFISAEIGENERIALMGESGSGKSTLGRLLLGFERPTSGSILWNGEDIKKISKKSYYRQVQSVFQDNQSCLNPRLTIERSLIEPINNYVKADKTTTTKRVLDILDEVELSKKVLTMYPHELSGGMQKRVCIARALSVSPKFILFDEAVSGLDTTTTIKILDLIKKVQMEEKYSFLFITHNLNVADYMSNRYWELKDGKVTDIKKRNGEITNVYEKN